MDADPETMLEGVATSEHVAAGAGFTVTDNVFATGVDPVIPLQVKVYEAFVDGDTTSDPDNVFVPVHEPVAEQEVALEAVQFNVVDCP